MLPRSGDGLSKVVMVRWMDMSSVGGSGKRVSDGRIDDISSLLFCCLVHMGTAVEGSYPDYIFRQAGLP